MKMNSRKIRPTNSLLAFAVLAVISLLTNIVAAQSHGYKVIVNPSISINSISRDELSRILL
jgi:hypothetical protein